MLLRTPAMKTGFLHTLVAGQVCARAAGSAVAFPTVLAFFSPGPFAMSLGAPRPDFFNLGGIWKQALIFYPSVVALTPSLGVLDTPL